MLLAVWVAAACSAAPAPRPTHPASGDDADADGLVVPDDRCPDAPEDLDGFRDGDGCLDADDDEDGIADADDLCRCTAEDVDGFEDDDGCADPDDDRDRIPDACDVCPREPETYDGCADDDGCPDRAHVEISASRIAIIEHVRFAPDSFDLTPRSIPLLDAIAATLIANPQITRVRIVGHADGTEAAPDRLGRKRAEVVRDWLTAHGVASARLEVASAGATQPLAPSTAAALRWQNRRASFELVEIDGQPFTGGTGAPPVASPPSRCSPTSFAAPCAADPARIEPIDVCARERERG